MTVRELVDAISNIKMHIEYINAWNAKGNIPPLGFRFNSLAELVDVYGDMSVLEWKIEGDWSYVDLNVRMAIRESKWEN